MSDPDAVERALRRSLAEGEYTALAELYADDAVLDANLQGERLKIAGPEAIAGALGARFGGPARLVDWDSKVHPEGVELWMERVAEDGSAARQRQYLHVELGRISRHWIYAAPPRSGLSSGSVGLDPSLLSGLGRVVEHEPFASRGWSGSALERLTLADGRRLIAKRIDPSADWLARHLGGSAREALLFRSGVLSRVPSALDQAIVATEYDGKSWWLVMRDVSDLMLDDHSRLSRAWSRRILEAANLLWEEFWGERVAELAALGDRLHVTAASIAGEERDGLDLLPKQFEATWEAFAAAVDDDVAEPVLELSERPEPLVAALDARGTTMIHADIRDEQLGFADGRVLLLDWGVATQGHPVVDFFWSMCHNGWRIDATHDELVEDFRRARGERDDPDAIELGVIAGLVMYGWIFGHSAASHPDPAERAWARAELDWWVPRARRALETWSPG